MYFTMICINNERSEMYFMRERMQFQLMDQIINILLYREYHENTQLGIQKVRFPMTVFIYNENIEENYTQHCIQYHKITCYHCCKGNEIELRILTMITFFATNLKRCELLIPEFLMNIRIKIRTTLRIMKYFLIYVQCDKHQSHEMV